LQPEPGGADWCGLPAGISFGSRTSSELVVTHSNALYKNTASATACMNSPIEWPCSGLTGVFNANPSFASPISTIAIVAAITR